MSSRRLAASRFPPSTIAWTHRTFRLKRQLASPVTRRLQPFQLPRVHLVRFSKEPVSIEVFRLRTIRRTTVQHRPIGPQNRRFRRRKNRRHSTTTAIRPIHSPTYWSRTRLTISYVNICPVTMVLKGDWALVTNRRRRRAVLSICRRSLSLNLRLQNCGIGLRKATVLLPIRVRVGFVLNWVRRFVEVHVLDCKRIYSFCFDWLNCCSMYRVLLPWAEYFSICGMHFLSMCITVLYIGHHTCNKLDVITGKWYS